MVLKSIFSLIFSIIYCSGSEFPDLIETINKSSSIEIHSWNSKIDATIKIRGTCGLTQGINSKIMQSWIVGDSVFSATTNRSTIVSMSIIGGRNTIIYNSLGLKDQVSVPIIVIINGKSILLALSLTELGILTPVKKELFDKIKMEIDKLDD